METNSVLLFNQLNYQLPKGVKAPIIIAWKLRTPGNFGYLLRIADTVGCLKVIFVTDSIQMAHRKIRKTAGDSYDRMEFEFTTEKELLNLIPQEYQLVALETSEGSENIYQTILPRNMALVVGNEKSGVDIEFIEQCNKIIHIPLTGKCTSLNVSHATAIALFEWLRQNLA